jgi:hypothetical protein
MTDRTATHRFLLNPFPIPSPSKTLIHKSVILLPRKPKLLRPSGGKPRRFGMNGKDAWAKLKNSGISGNSERHRDLACPQNNQ